MYGRQIGFTCGRTFSLERKSLFSLEQEESNRPELFLIRWKCVLIKNSSHIGRFHWSDGKGVLLKDDRWLVEIHNFIILIMSYFIYQFMHIWNYSLSKDQTHLWPENNLFDNLSKGIKSSTDTNNSRSCLKGGKQYKYNFCLDRNHCTIEVIL